MTELTLYPEQQVAYEFVLERDSAALFGEQRTGKTFITMAVLRQLTKIDFTGVLLCVLNNRDSTWLDKLTEYLPQLNVTTDWEAFKKLATPRLFLVHFNVFPATIKKMVKFKAINWMGIDEAQGIANRGTKQSRAAARMSWVHRKLIMSGTPIEKKPTDLFGQFRFLDPNVFGTNWKDFEEEYMDLPVAKDIKAPAGSQAWQKRMMQQRIMRGKAKFDETKMPQFINRIKPISIRLTKLDVGILEPQVHRVRVPILGAQRRYYEAMKDTSVVHLDDGQRVLAQLAITNIMKQRQLAAGFVYDDDGELHYVGDAKLRRLRTLVDSLPKPVVVFTAFRPDNARVARALRNDGYEVAVVTGSTKKKLRPQMWRDHQRAQFDVIVVQIKTGGVGIDLWKAGHAIVHSMGQSFRDFDQAKSRLDVKGKSKAAQIHVLCCAGTIDEDLYDLVVIKRLNSDAVLNQLKRRIRNA